MDIAQVLVAIATNSEKIIEAVVANYQVIIAAIAFIVLSIYIYRIAQVVNDSEKNKGIIDGKIQLLELKYETSEKMKKLELDIERLSIEIKAEKEYVREHLEILEKCEKLESSIKSLEDGMRVRK
jgi:uncharacterized protein YlxW (UPF0749 family)